MHPRKGDTVLCFLTARRLRSGSFQDFRHAWEPEEWPEQFVRAYHVRDLDDPDVVVSFGFFEGEADDYRRLRSEPSANEVEDRRQRRMAEYVEETLLDGVWEVVDEVEPRGV